MNISTRSPFIREESESVDPRSEHRPFKVTAHQNNCLHWRSLEGHCGKWKFFKIVFVFCFWLISGTEYFLKKVFFQIEFVVKIEWVFTIMNGNYVILLSYLVILFTFNRNYLHTRERIWDIVHVHCTQIDIWKQKRIHRHMLKSYNLKRLNKERGK